MTLPNFLIVGAAKSGTTSLYHYLRQHPEVYVSPVKEPNFFVFGDGWQQEAAASALPDKAIRQSTRNLRDYEALFAGARAARAIGEASTSYLYTPGVPERICQTLPGVKILVILRNPVDCSYSRHMMDVRDERQSPENFLRVFHEPKSPLRYPGFYHSHLQRYYRVFDRRAIKIVFYEDLASRPNDLLRSLFGFLGIDDRFRPDVRTRYNVSGLPKNRSLNAIWRQLARLNRMYGLSQRLPRHAASQRAVDFFVRRRGHNLTPGSLPPEVRAAVVDVYRADILELQELVKRDLTHWLD